MAYTLQQVLKMAQNETIAVRNQPQTLVKKDECYEISTYCDTPANDKNLQNEFIRLKSVFLNLDNKFLIVLTERVVANNFTAQRLHDAVSYIIDNHKYPTLVVSDIIQYDRKCKLYTYTQKCNKIYNKENADEDFVMVQVDGKNLWKLITE